MSSWVYKFDITGDTAKLMRRYRVGLGDNPAGSSIGALTSPRMDSRRSSTTFSHTPGTGTLGRITPAVAIELDTVSLSSVVVDLANTVVESNEADNTAAATFRVMGGRIVSS